MSATEHSWVEVDLKALDHNLQVFGDLIGPDQRTIICGVVKADAYGHGAGAIAQRLVANGVELLAVYDTRQARELMQSGYAGPILIMGVFDELERGELLYRAAVTDRLDITIHSLDQLEKVAAIGQSLGCRLRVHLFLDTGMSRGGLSDQQFAKALPVVTGCRHLTLAGIATHMASSDDDPSFTEKQHACLQRVLHDHAAQLDQHVAVHIANTLTALRDRRYHCDMLRIGLGLYGFGEQLMEGGVSIDHVLPLKPIARWCSRVVHVRNFPRGAGVGYNQTCHLTRDSVLGIVPVGYADGYHLVLGNRAHVRLSDYSTDAAVMGSVNMDQIVIDLTDTPQIQMGDEVELYSNDLAAKSSVPALAALAQSNCYEMLTNIKPHIPRRYLR